MTLRLFCLLLLFGHLSQASAQNPAENANERSPAAVESLTPHTVAESLRSHKIGLAQANLIGALKNTDPEVRYLAALKLAENKATDAIPQMLEALASEKVELTKVKLAMALAEIGNESGFKTLEDGCQDRNWSIRTRVEAAEYIADFRPDSTVCLNSLLELTETASAGYRIQALTILSTLHGLSPEDSQKILQAALNGLRAPQPAVRIAASHAAVELGNIVAVPELEKAITREHEEPVRSQIERDMTILKGKQDRATPNP
jgi:HEAT repeat protein